MAMGEMIHPGIALGIVCIPLRSTTNVVIDLEVLDKRETGGNSTTMEKEGLRRLIQCLMNKLPLDKICTDASSTIIQLIRDMKGMGLTNNHCNCNSLV